MGGNEFFRSSVCDWRNDASVGEVRVNKDVASTDVVHVTVAVDAQLHVAVVTPAGSEVGAEDPVTTAQKVFLISLNSRVKSDNSHHGIDVNIGVGLSRARALGLGQDSRLVIVNTVGKVDCDTDRLVGGEVLKHGRINHKVLS